MIIIAYIAIAFIGGFSLGFILGAIGIVSAARNHVEKTEFKGFITQKDLPTGDQRQTDPIIWGDYDGDPKDY